MWSNDEGREDIMCDACNGENALFWGATDTSKNYDVCGWCLTHEILELHKFECGLFEPRLTDCKSCHEGKVFECAIDPSCSACIAQRAVEFAEFFEDSPDAEPGAELGAEPGDEPVVEPGVESGAESAAEPGVESGAEPAAEPGAEPAAEFVAAEVEETQYDTYYDYLDALREENPVKYAAFAKEC